MYCEITLACATPDGFESEAEEEPATATDVAIVAAGMSLTQLKLTAKPEKKFFPYTTRRPGRAGPTSLGGEATRPYATAFARGVGRGIAGGGVNRIKQRRRDGGGAAAEKG